MPEPSDQDCLIATATGSRGAFRLIVERHRDSIHRFACSLVRDSALADDVVQETFVAALRHAGGFRGEGSVRGWLLTICRNQARSLQRQRRDEPTDDASLQALGLAAGWGRAEPAGSLADQLSSRELLEKGLDRLNATEREIIMLADVEGLTGEETCRALGLTRAAMKSRLHRARLALVAAMTEEVGDG